MRLSKKRAEQLLGLAFHLNMEYSTYGDEWEYIACMDEKDKKVVQDTIEWLMEFACKKRRGNG